MAIELISTIKPKNNGSFPVVEDNDIKGGYHSVTSIAMRDAIPVTKRSPGMLCYVSDTCKIYKLSEDLRNDFILTSRNGYSHAQDVSAYSLVAITRMAREKDMLNEGASIIAYTYYGSEKVVEGYNVMGVAKAALEASIRYLAKDLGKDGFRINGISAGPIKTLSAKGIKDFGSILDVVEEKAPLHRNVTTKDVGDATAFLFSNMSNAITGEIIHVDNGFSIIGV